MVTDKERRDFLRHFDFFFSELDEEILSGILNRNYGNSVRAVETIYCDFQCALFLS